MRTLTTFVLPFLVWTVWGASAQAQAVDLSKIDRTIKKEPNYKNKPKYCLLVFGPEAKSRVWLVVDGDALYVDRTGNGDLTGEGKRIAGVGRGEDSMVFNFQVASDADGKTKHTLHAYLSGEGFQILMNHQSRYEQAQPYWGVDGKFADRPQDAPLVHFDGPLAFELEKPVFVRGAKPLSLEVRIGTPGFGKARLGSPGLGKGTYTLLLGTPKWPAAAAEIVFPNRDPAGKPIVVRVPLDQKH